MNKLLYLLVLTVILAIAACGQSIFGGDSPQFTGVTETGYSYIIHNDQPGETARVGDRIRYSRQIRLGADSVIAPVTEQMVVMPEKVQLPKPLPADFELLLLLSPGDSASVYVFGEQLKAIPNNVRGEKDTIIYDIVMREIVETKEQREKSVDRVAEAESRLNQAITAYDKGLIANALQRTDSGLEILHIAEGNGPAPQEGQTVDVHYIGALKDKQIFDNSLEKGMPFSFQRGANQVIPGWDEGIGLLKKGGKAIFIIPSDLAYGARGSAPMIPPFATLYFYVELIDIR